MVKLTQDYPQLEPFLEFWRFPSKILLPIFQFNLKNPSFWGRLRFEDLSIFPILCLQFACRPKNVFCVVRARICVSCVCVCVFFFIYFYIFCLAKDYIKVRANDFDGSHIIFYFDLKNRGWIGTLSKNNNAFLHCFGDRGNNASMIGRYTASGLFQRFLILNFTLLPLKKLKKGTPDFTGSKINSLMSLLNF